MVDLIPSSFLRFPAFWDDEDFPIASTNNASGGLSISEDDKKVYVEAAVPGIDPKDIEITFDKSVLWIKGESKEEEKGKKFYRRLASSFSYRVAVPGDLDANVEPEASCKNGVMKVAFMKSPKSQPKKISIKSA